MGVNFFLGTLKLKNIEETPKESFRSSSMSSFKDETAQAKNEIIDEADEVVVEGAGAIGHTANSVSGQSEILLGDTTPKDRRSSMNNSGM